MAIIFKLSPAQNYYLIQPLEEQDTNIIIATIDEQPFIKGVVLEVGGSFKSEYGATIEPQFKVGDQVLYNASKFNEVHEKGETAHLVRFGAVVAKYE